MRIGSVGHSVSVGAARIFNALTGAPKNRQQDVVTISRGASTAATKAPSLEDRLQALLPDKPMMIPKDRVDSLCKQLGAAPEELLQALIGTAKTQARPPVSQFHVGAAGLGKSGNIYLGVNLEFANLPLEFTVHGEQCVTANAYLHGETQLVALAVSAAPCGHCRQFLNELVGSDGLQILVPGKDATVLSKELPENFGPKDLNVDGALLSPKANGLTLAARNSVWSVSADHAMGINIAHGLGVFDDSAASTINAIRMPLPVNMLPPEDKVLVNAALVAANRSYAPYSKDPSGIAIRTVDGKIYTGMYAENAAFNPTLNPIQGALIAMVLDGKQYADIRGVSLVEPTSAGINPHEVSQVDWTLDLLHHIAPDATLSVYGADRAPST